MREKKEKTFLSLETISPNQSAHLAALNAIDEAIQKINEDYDNEITKIEANFDLFANENKKSYERYEEDYTKVLAYIDHEFEGLFNALDEDFVAHRQKLEHELEQEDLVYKEIITSFETMKEDALKTYHDLCKQSEEAINKETEIHQNFVNEKNADFEATREQYSLINNKQYDILLWTMEKSRNALNALTKQLNEQAFNDTRFMNAAVTQIIEGLRETKKKITVLFKTTTLGYAEKRNRIDELSEIRQIPYSEINQTLIDQYVHQIAIANQKKINFDRLVQEDSLKSSMIVGKRIIEADEAKKHHLVRKYILQYGIIKAKSNYLLKRNQELSDLLISKYQNEIRKIKVDSFKRVEEIKLAYSMPSQFFQNSINLYSNFAFYVSESLDEIDNMLTDLIRFDQNITQTFVDYLKSSAKVFEDYKINCLVTVNNVTSKMTDLITNIDRYSKDIVSLESNNRLEIAEVKKMMENSDITGDFDKYSASVGCDRDIADFQHTINIKKISMAADNEASLLVIQREVVERNKQKQVDEAAMKHDKLITNLERTIHDQAYDKELAIMDAKHRRDLAIIDLEEKRAIEIQNFEGTAQKHQFSQMLTRQLETYQENKAAGSDFVVDFVHQTQRLIDIKNQWTQKEMEYLDSADHPRSYAYLLEDNRNLALNQLRFRSQQQIEPHEKAIEYFDHQLSVTRNNLKKQINKQTLSIKHLLVNLTDNNAALQAESLSLEHYYRYLVLSVIKNSRDTVSSLISEEQNPSLLEKATRLIDEDFKKVAILTTSAEQQSLLNVKSNRGLAKTLKTFYIEMLIHLKAFLNHIDLILDELEESLIVKDVLIRKKYQDEYAKKEQLVNDSFDEAIFDAVKKKKEAVHHGKKQVDHESKEIETVLADKVFRLNKTYVDGLSEQEDFLKYLDQKLVKERKKSNRQNESLLSKVHKDYELKKQNLTVYQQAYIKGYELQKKKNYTAANTANDHVLQQLALQDKQRLQGIEKLNENIATLPAKQETFLKNIESEKEKFIIDKKSALHQKLAQIEEQKFVARPQFLQKMADIRDRLPNDYMALYKQITEAQSTLVKEFQPTNDQYAQEFNRFVNNQVEYNSIIFNDSIVLHPYERFLIISDRIKLKTDEVFKDTVTKSAIKQEAMKKQVADSDEKQKRILNA